MAFLILTSPNSETITVNSTFIIEYTSTVGGGSLIKIEDAKFPQRTLEVADSKADIDTALSAVTP